MLTVGSVFAGIGGFDLAFERAGAKVIWNCEIDRHCRSVLRHHWPGTPRFKDVKTVTGSGLEAAGLRPDVLVGGFPCQDVSVAGARAGLAGERSGLFFEFARLLDELRPPWTVIENVPGLLSSNRGGDMGAVLGVLADLGYGLAWRVLDAQYFGVAQRRRRVFLVGCLGDGDRAAAVLLESEGGGGDPPARRAPGPVPAALTANGVGTCGPDDNQCQAGHWVPVTGLPTDVPVAGTLGGGSGNRGWADDLDRSTFLGTMPQLSHSLCAPPVDGAHNDHNGETLLPVAYRKATTSHGPANEWERWEEAAHTNRLDAGSNVTRNAHAVVTEMAVRRLTPLECLRLQGFPDDWLDGLGLADSVKYRMVGNAVAVPVVEWLAHRLLRLIDIDGLDQSGVGEHGGHLELDQGHGGLGVGGVNGDVDVEVDEDGDCVVAHSQEDDKPARRVKRTNR